jgi:hypothetical protein
VFVIAEPEYSGVEEVALPWRGKSSCAKSIHRCPVAIAVATRLADFRSAHFAPTPIQLTRFGLAEFVL